MDIFFSTVRYLNFTNICGCSMCGCIAIYMIQFYILILQLQFYILILQLLCLVDPIIITSVDCLLEHLFAQSGQVVYYMYNY